MNSPFIILILRKDLELQNGDVMMKEVERLLYLNTDSLGFKTTKHQSNVYFLLMFSCSFFSGASKTTRRKTQADFDTSFCDVLRVILLEGHVAVYWLPVSLL